MFTCFKTFSLPFYVQAIGRGGVKSRKLSVKAGDGWVMYQLLKITISCGAEDPGCSSGPAPLCRRNQSQSGAQAKSVDILKPSQYTFHVILQTIFYSVLRNWNMLFDNIRYVQQVNQVQAELLFLFSFLNLFLLTFIVGRLSGSQGELLSQNRWSMNEEEQRGTDR